MSRPLYHYRQPDYTLMEAFNVSENDIKLNRKGDITPAQKRRIWLDRTPTVAGFTGTWLFATMMFLAFRSAAADSLSTNVLGGVMVVTFFALVFIIVRAFRIVADVTVNTAIGIATIEKRDGRYGGWFIVIDGRSFELKPAQYNVLQDRIPLAIYYIDHRKRILSLEQIVFTRD